MRKNLVYFLAGTVVFLYVLTRAIKLGITYDEAWTINSYVFKSFKEIINCSVCDTNNQLLNTLLIKLFFLPGNHALLIARLPNVIAFILYMVFAYRISGFVNSVVGIGIFLLLILNPFLLDFFSLARGYGMAVAFQLASLYYCFLFVKECKSKFATLSFAFASFSVLSNFSFLNYWIVLLILIVALPFVQKGPFNTKTLFLNISLILLPLIFLIFKPIIKLKEGGNLYYGGTNNFYSDTLASLTKYTLYGESSHVTWILNAFLLLLVASYIVSFSHNRSFFSIKNILLSMLLLTIFSTIAQHYLFGTLYLIDRTALLFYPLFILLLCFSFNDIQPNSAKAILFVTVLFFSINSLNHFNLYKTATWYFDAHSAEILGWINGKGKEKNQKKKLDFSWPFQSSIGYYYGKYQYPFIEIVKNTNDREDLNREADYYIYLNRSLEKVGYESASQKITPLSKDTALAFPEEAVYVFTNLR